MCNICNKWQLRAFCGSAGNSWTQCEWRKEVDGMHLTNGSHSVVFGWTLTVSLDWPSSPTTSSAVWSASGPSSSVYFGPNIMQMFYFDLGMFCVKICIWVVPTLVRCVIKYYHQSTNSNCCTIIQGIQRSKRKQIRSKEIWLPSRAVWMTLPPYWVCFSGVKPGKVIIWNIWKVYKLSIRFF